MSAPNSITTKVGDRGTTFLFSGEEIAKDSPRTMAYGDLDELVSLLGVARCQVTREDIRQDLLSLQRDLFVAGSELATSLDHVKLLKQRIGENELRQFEARRDKWEKNIKMPDGFIIPGGSGSLGAAHLDHARTVARRLERRVVALSREKLINNQPLLVWLNRLSDYLWLLARAEEGESLSLRDFQRQKDGTPE